MNETIESKAPGTAGVARAARHAARRSRFGGSGVMALGVLCLAAGVVVACLGVADLSSRATPAAANPVTDSSRTPDRLQRIDTVRVGQRVIAGNPQVDADDVEQIEPVDPATWRKITLRMSKPAGGRVDIVLLRPQVWLDVQGAARGQTIRLDLAELGAAGPGEVLAVEPCPAIEPGPGRVVTGTFAHSAANVVDLRIRGASAPIGTTANHPFWSEDRRAFIPAGQLRPGETLRTLSSLSHVVSITPRAGPERVYNLEVHAEHTYHVALAGVLVHNACNIDLELDSLGRTQSASARIRRADIGTGTGTTKAAREYVRSIGNESDDAGHLIARLLAGRGGKTAGNVFPQNPLINRRDFRMYERLVANEILAGKDVFVKVTLKYAGTSTRPYEVVYDVTVDGVEWLPKFFAN